MVHSEIKFIGTFQTVSNDSVKVVAIPLRSCFSFVSISSFSHLAIFLNMIAKLVPGLTITPEITKCLILHLVVTIFVAVSTL
jgi:hypothetical protein